MKSLFGPKRRKALGKAFLNMSTLLVPAAVTSDFLFKFGFATRMLVVSLAGAMLISGWLVTPEKDEKEEDEDDEGI